MNLPVTWPDPSQPGVGHFLENRGDTSVGPSSEQHRGMSQQSHSSAPEHGQPLPWPWKAQERWAEQIPKARLLGTGHSPFLHAQTLASLQPWARHQRADGAAHWGSQSLHLSCPHRHPGQPQSEQSACARSLGSRESPGRQTCPPHPYGHSTILAPPDTSLVLALALDPAWFPLEKVPQVTA